MSAAAARRFLVRRHLLGPARSLPSGREGVRAAFDQLGSVQFDPLGVAGRNHDLVLHARVADYDPAWTTALLYEERWLFETYNKMLSLLPTRELPWFRRSWDSFRSFHEERAFDRFPETVERVLARLRDEAPLSSLDFERGARIDWYWGPTSEVRAVLEALSEAGVISLARREGNRRYFDLTERLYPPELLATEVTVTEQRRHMLLSRYRAHGMLGERGGYELWYGITRPPSLGVDPAETHSRAELHAQLVTAGSIVPVQVEGVRGMRYVLGEEVELLRSSTAEVEAGRQMAGASVAFLAPLDPLAWDRDFLRSLFGFDYVWEVYVPAAKRRWGYYVLPLLWGDRLVGRIEPRIDRESGTVRILGLWWEDGFDPRRAEGFIEAMREALGAYLRFAGARRLDWGALSGPRRLFGVRP